MNAERLWTELASAAKQRLQKVIFRQGITFAEGNYRTTETCLFFKLLQQSEAKNTGLATLPGIESCFAIFANLRELLRKPHE